MKKQGSVFTNTMLLTLVVLVGVGIGFVTNWFGLIPEPTETIEEISEISKAGELTSFKLSVKDDGDSPNRYAGTGYCWYLDEPTTLIGGGSTSLSATAGTSISPVVIGKTVRCVAFDSTHHGMPENKQIKTEGEQLILDSKNISSLVGIHFYEDNTKETTPSLTIPQSGTKKFNKIVFEGNVSDAGLNMKELCFGSNNSNSEVSSIEVGGLSTQSRIPYTLRNTHNFCFKWDNAVFLRDYDEIETGVVKITVTDSFTATETINMTIIDEAYFESIDGSIKLDTQADDVTPDDVGSSYVSTSFTLIKQ